MNKRVFILLAIGGVLAGCSGVSQLPANGEMFGSTGVLSVPGCVEYIGLEPVCSGVNTKAKVIINLAAEPFEITPKCVKAKKGRKIQFDLISSETIAAESVVIFPKDPANYPWLAGTNDSSNPNKIKIKVPDKKQSGIYEYGIYTAKHCMDPRIKVEN